MVDFIASDRSLRKLVFEEFEIRLDGFLQDLESLGVHLWDFLSDIAHPGDVGIDAFRVVHFRPHIDKDQIAFSDWGGDFFAWAVMRVACVLADRDDSRVVIDHAFFVESIADEFLDFVFAGLAILKNELFDFGEGLIFDHEGFLVGKELKLIGSFTI